MSGQLVYFADPMCSWCWGFAPVIEAVRRRFGDELPVRLILGGLRPGTIEVMDDANSSNDKKGNKALKYAFQMRPKSHKLSAASAKPHYTQAHAQRSGHERQ